MTSSNENICCVTGLLWGEFTGHRWIPLAKASDVELSWSALEQTVEQTTETPVIWDAIVFIMMPLECVMTFEANLGLYIQYIGHSKKKCRSTSNLRICEPRPTNRLVFCYRHQSPFYICVIFVWMKTQRVHTTHLLRIWACTKMFYQTGNTGVWW